MAFTSNFTLFTEQTSLQQYNAHIRALALLSLRTTADTTLAYAITNQKRFDEWCVGADARLYRLGCAKHALPYHLHYIADQEIGWFARWRGDMGNAADEAWWEAYIASQAVLILENDTALLQGDCEALFVEGDAVGEDEDGSPIKDKHRKDSFVPDFSRAVEIATPSATPTDPEPRSPDPRPRGQCPLTPEQMEQLLLLWNDEPALKNWHHHKFIRDLERQDRDVASNTWEEKRVGIEEWLDGLPLR